MIGESTHELHVSSIHILGVFVFIKNNVLASFIIVERSDTSKIVQLCMYEGSLLNEMSVKFVLVIPHY